MITHKEAEILTSARQDAPLDPMVERELQAHLATCDECRAFAVATERLTAGIKAMPSIPVNPRTRREVMEHVQRGRNPLSTIFAGFGGGFQTGPVLAAAATLLIIGLFGWMALDRLVFDDGGSSDQNQLAAVPTEQAVERFVASPTQVSPTETSEPTETPAPTETSEPTETPAPTETPEPTEIPDPTATLAPEPTATTIPTEEPEAQSTEDDSGAVDLTTTSVDSATETPTATEDVVPTATTVPTDVATEELTTEAEPTSTPPIEPMDGPQDGTEEPEPTQPAEGTGSGPAIEPTGDEEAGNTSGVIEPIDGTPTEPDGEPDDSAPVESTPEDEGVEQEEPEVPAGQSLADASVRYSGIAGDPSGQLGLTRDGRLEFMQIPDGAAYTTTGGFRLSFAEAQPGVVHLCGDDFCEPAVETPESEAWQGDVPLGVIGDTSYFMRMYSDHTEVYAAVSEGTQLIEPTLIAELGPTSPPPAVYENDGIMFAWLPSGEWLEISGGSAQIFSGSYSDPSNLRFAPMASNGPLIGYFSNGTLVIAPVTSPDAAILTLPTDGIDFDISRDGDRVAVIQGNSIVIYDIQGNVLSVYEGGDIQPGSLIWLRGGIVYVDRATGALFEMPETAP